LRENDTVRSFVLASMDYLKKRASLTKGNKTFLFGVIRAFEHASLKGADLVNSLVETVRVFELCGDDKDPGSFLPQASVRSWLNEFKQSIFSKRKTCKTELKKEELKIGLEAAIKKLEKGATSPKKAQ